MNIEEEFKLENFGKCLGCSILSKPLPTHSILDYENLREVEVLFVSDSFKLYQGEYVPFRANEYITIVKELKIDKKRVGFTASVKCPNIREDDISAKDRKICKSHLDDTILKCKPKLVFACGKLATTMFYGKNIEDKKSRGKINDFEVLGHKFKLVSIFHPYQVISEPKNQYLFSLDINLAIDEVILCVEKKTDLNYVQIHSVEDISKYTTLFTETINPVSLDIETTGFDFTEDIIHTIAMSTMTDEDSIITLAIPIDHKAITDYPNSFKLEVIEFVKKVCANKRNKKILQRATFDLKFLYRYGVKEVYNVWDTKLMQHIYNEDVPKGLADLVTYYYPNEI